MTNTETTKEQLSIGLQTNSLSLHCICKEFFALFWVVRNYLSEKVQSEKKKQTIEDFGSILTEEFDNVDCDGACAQSSLCQVLITQAKEIIDTGTRLLKYVDTSKINPLFKEANNQRAAESTEEVIEPANHEASTELRAGANHEASTELRAGASGDALQIELGGETNHEASMKLDEAANHEAPIELGEAASQDSQIELSSVYVDIYTSAEDNSPHVCLGGNDGNKERKSEIPESDVRTKVKALEKNESTLGTSRDQPRQFLPPQRPMRSLQSGDLPSNYSPHLKPREDDDLRINSAPEARSHDHQQFLSLDSSSSRFPQTRQPIKFQSCGQYYHGLPEFRNKNLRQNGTTSMHESLMDHQIPEGQTESFTNYQPRQYHSAPAPQNSSSLEEDARMARSPSERTLASFPVPRLNCMSNYDTPNALQADGSDFSSMAKSSSPLSSNQTPSGDAVPSSSSSRLVTDNAHAPAVPIEPTSGASGNSDSIAAADVTDLTIPDSEPNLTQNEEVSASAATRPEPRDEATSRNSSGENDFDAVDGAFGHDVLPDDVTVISPTVNNTRPDERCYSAPAELTRNSEKRTPERNFPNENVVPSTSRTQVRSTSASSELSSRQNRRVLRAQRRNRRQTRNRSPSNHPPEGAKAASNGTHSRRSHNNNHDVVERFGLIVPEDEDENLDPEEIRKENQRLKNARLCQVCKDKDANRLFLPCAHLSSCSLCSPALTKCPQCKANIRGIVSVYFG